MIADRVRSFSFYEFQIQDAVIIGLFPGRLFAGPKGREFGAVALSGTQLKEAQRLKGVAEGWIKGQAIRPLVSESGAGATWARKSRHGSRSQTEATRRVPLSFS